MNRAIEESRGRLAPESYAPISTRRFWAAYERHIQSFFDTLEARETWVRRDAGASPSSFIALMNHLPQSGRLPAEGLARLMRILAALPFSECIHALQWLDERSAPAVRDVMHSSYEHRAHSAAANILWQRLQRVARVHVLEGLMRDITADAPATRSCGAEEVSALEKTTHALPNAPSARLCVIHNEETLPFLEEKRPIGSLNEVDELFGNRRFYLLTEDLALCKSLAAYGVGVDQYGGYVTRGPACDFDRLDPLLPLVARRAIKPLFGDLIPHSSWASNLARLLTRSTWEAIRRPLIQSMGNRCEICGAKDAALDCHERWEYHDPMYEGGRGVQRLVGFWAMCADCHATQHLTRSGDSAQSAEALERLRRIGRLSEREAQAYRAFVLERRARRSSVSWVLDLSCLSVLEPLVVHSGWTLDAQGFLNQERERREGAPVPARTMLFGVSWKFSTAGSRIHPARPAHDAYYE